MEQPALTTTALVLHNLGLAAGFGGALFGQASLNPAVKVLPDKSDRGQVLQAAWDGQKWINAVSLGAVALTWFTGRRMVPARALGRDAKALAITKDVLVATSLVATLVNAGLGAYMSSQNDGWIPVESGRQPSAETPPDKARTQRLLNVFGIVNLVASAGVIATTAWLNQKAAASHRWGFLSKVLP